MEGSSALAGYGKGGSSWTMRLSGVSCIVLWLWIVYRLAVHHSRGHDLAQAAKSVQNPLYIGTPSGNASGMLNRVCWSLVASVALLFVGCATNTITNLTPGNAPRSTDSLYMIEARWDSSQRSVRNETLTPYVLIGTDLYPMERTLLTSNRWEAIVPISDEKRFVNYQFKFDYDYASVPFRRRDSKLSRPYQLEIVDR